MATGPGNVSEPALDYGRAMCLPEADQYKLWDQLTPDQQRCVGEVGGTFEHKVEEKMGFTNQTTDPPDRGHSETTAVRGPTGQQVGTVDFDHGVVTVCWTAPPPNTAPGCEFIGYGLDGYLSAQLLLDTLGFHTG